jgi:hypothetical protein
LTVLIQDSKKALPTFFNFTKRADPQRLTLYSEEHHEIGAVHFQESG